MQSVKVHRAALWILGEYAYLPEDIQTVMTQVRQTLGEIPIVEDELKRAAGEKSEDDLSFSQGPVQKLVTSDGTYATQSSFNTLSYVSHFSHCNSSVNFMGNLIMYCQFVERQRKTKLDHRYVSISSTVISLSEPPWVPHWPN